MVVVVGLVAVMTAVAVVAMVARRGGERRGGGEQQNGNDGKFDHDLDGLPEWDRAANCNPLKARQQSVYRASDFSTASTHGVDQPLRTPHQ